MRKDQGYKPMAEEAGVKIHTFSFEESQAMCRAVWDAAGSAAFSAPNGNMIAVLCNLAAQEAIQRKVRK